ncbi:MAG TPA: UbiA family prenyltransferase [Thermoanaerobaculia bacterium]|nr:UbiA family prenyltransferase [Thermoanaerobaculia bacterium]
MTRSKLSLYMQLARPFTLLPPLLGIISGAICAFGSVHNPDPSRQITASVILTVVLGSLCASFMNAASNAINQIYDLEIDRVNKPGRPLVTGELSVREAWGFTWLFYALALIPTWLVVPHPYDTFQQKLTAPLAEHACFFIYLLGLIATFIYSAPELGRTKVRGMLANFTIAIPRGILLKVAGWAMVARVWHVEPWFIGSIFGLYLLGAATTKDFADMEGDRAGGCRTLPILYGVEKAAWIIAPFFIFPWLLMPLGAFLADPQNPSHPILTGNPWFLTALGVLFTLWGCYTVWLLLRDPKSLTETENHPSWKHMYLIMMAGQVGFALAYIL